MDEVAGEVPHHRPQLIDGVVDPRDPVEVRIANETGLAVVVLLRRHQKEQCVKRIFVRIVGKWRG